MMCTLFKLGFAKAILLQALCVSIFRSLHTDLIYQLGEPLCCKLAGQA